MRYEHSKVWFDVLDTDIVSALELKELGLVSDEAEAVDDAIEYSTVGESLHEMAARKERSPQS